MANPTPSIILSPPDPVPSVIFNEFDTIVSCSSGTISWDTQGYPTDMSLFVTNEIDGFPPPTTFYNITLATHVNPLVEMYKWNPVTVPIGQYVIWGCYNGEVSISPTFFVSSGPDNSCLAGNTPIPSPNPTSESVTTTPPSNNTDTPIPIGAIASDSHSHVGAIAGGTIGGIALLLLILLGVYAFLRYRRRVNRTRSASQSGAIGGGGGGAGKWNGLSSRESNIQSSLPQYAVGDRKVVPTGIRSVNQVQGPVSPVASDEDVSTLADEEKLEGGEYVNSVAPLPYTGQPHHHHRRSSTGSVLSSPPRSPTQHRIPPPKLDANGAYAYSRRQSLDTRVLSSTPSSGSHTPVSPTNMPEMIAMDIKRTSSGHRRVATTRKPVPTYTSSEVDVTSASSEFGVAPLTTTDIDRSRSVGSESATTLNSHGGGAAWKSREDLVGLSHKASFGEGRQVHYLIPDMPPPQKD
ncbi:hypothetical protein BXZ70DRAFT_74931 [Cristinia sonorae]|uniref:Uncharacterized protein n=1 Tax=Cristinia sonorae TaxID=1940300 RepID=A0A8K0UQD1_9AGAR|nr:hypothetical protein BXZ70DRAFT_74931 [Cristinia sonorae]